MIKHTLLTIIVTVLCISSAFSDIPIVFEKSKNVPLVHLSIAFRTGASHDPKERKGLTNFVGEMLLRGTKKKNKNALDQAIDDLGASLAVDTRQEAIIFRASVLSSELPNFLNLLTEIFTEPTFDEVEIEKLRNELISSLLESYGSDVKTAARFFQKLFYENHPYENPVLGTPTSLKKITRNDILNHYKKLMNTHSAIIVGSGWAEESEIRKFAKNIENKLPNDPNPVSIPKTEGPRELRIVIIDKPQRTQTQVIFGYQGITAKSESYTAFSIANYAFGGKAFSSRLFQEVRAKRGYSYFAYSGLTLGTHPRAWQLSMAPAEKDTAKAIKLVYDMVQNLHKNGITEDEFQFSTTSLINSHGFSFNTPAKRAENSLTEELLGLERGWTKKTVDRIRKTTLQEINESIQKNLDPSRALILVLGTAKNIKKPISEMMGVAESKIDVIPFDSE
jgi:zinc protease